MKKYLQFINEAFIPPPNKRSYPIEPKIGDVVKCLDDDNLFKPHIKKGQQYRITKILPGYFQLKKRIDDEETDNWWTPAYFELDTDEAKILRKKYDETIDELGLKEGNIIKFKSFYPSGQYEIEIGEVVSFEKNKIQELYVKYDIFIIKYIDFEFLKKSFLKKWDNWEEYYKENQKISKEDPYGEEIWDDELYEGQFYYEPTHPNDEKMVIDWLGNSIPFKDAVWCEYDKKWCLKKDAIRIDYQGFYTTPDIDSYIGKDKEEYDDDNIQWFENVNEGYRDYNKKLEYNVSKYINIENMQIEEAVEILIKEFIGYLIISPEFNEYILHVVDWKIHNGQIQFLYDNYYYNNIKNDIGRVDSIFLDKNTKIYLLDGVPEYAVTGRIISEVDPFGEEDWDDKELN